MSHLVNEPGARMEHLNEPVAEEEEARGAGGVAWWREPPTVERVGTFDLAAADARLIEILDDLEVPYERARPGAYLVRLEGTHKLATMTWLVLGERGLLVEAFFIRRPEENEAAFGAWLLRLNAATWGVHFAYDGLGDVYLVGRLPHGALTPQDVDTVLGCVLTYSDENFDRALEIGFASSIRREWAWRQSRGESTANLAAFARFASADASETPGSGGSQ